MSQENPEDVILMPTMEDSYDLLSFMSLFVINNTQLTPGFMLSQLVLDRMSTSLENPVDRGTSFSVVITDTSRIRNALHMEPPVAFLGARETVALKKPLLNKLSSTTNRSRQILNSMAIEYQTLQVASLRDHPNIIQLLAVCWQTVDVEKNLILPVLVLEAADYGNLAAFSKSDRKLTLREVMMLLLDIASGIAMLHESGIIHCDIKPENILIFKGSDRKFVAKIADFGSAVFLEHLEERTRLSNGTPLWQAPECSSLIERDHLRKIDVFSFGLVMLNLLSENKTVEIMRQDSSTNIQTLKDSDDLRTAAFKEIAIISHHLLAKSPEERPPMAKVVQDLRWVIHKLLAGIGTLVSPSDMWSHDEHDILMCPDLGEPLPEDITRINAALESACLIDSLFEQFNLEGRREKSKNALAAERVLKRWQNGPENPKPRAKLQRGPKAVFEVCASLGTMYLLPQPLLWQVIDSLKTAAKSTSDVRRQARASFELAFALINQLDRRETKNHELALAMLLQAAQLGVKAAQGIVGWLHAAYNVSMPPELTIELELEWLFNATVTGNPTARRRLKSLDEARHATAVHDLRRFYGGFGVKVIVSDAAIDCLEDRLELGMVDGLAPGSILRLAGATGSQQQALLTFKTWCIDPNSRDEWGDTALNFACRSGHWSMARYLIGRDADVAVASKEGITALHWLSSLPDDEIDEAAHLLIAKGADIESRTNGARHVYHRLREGDRPGCEDGTPLLWAVVSSNVKAIRALMRYGADPWDEAGATVETNNNWGDSIHYSPVHYASMLHMYDILEILLQDTPDDIDPTTSPLNAHYRRVGAPPSEQYVLPLLWAVSGGAQGIFRLMLLHGASFESAAQKTIEMLLRKGADPYKVDSSGMTAIEGACMRGRPSLLKILYDWQGGVLRPNLQVVGNLLGRAIVAHDKLVFDFLLESHKEDISNNTQILEQLIDISACRTHDPHFSESLIAVSSPNFQMNAGLLFTLALQSGNRKLVSALHPKLPFDPTYISSDGRTILADLIRRTKSCGSVLSILEFALSLIDLSCDEGKNGFWAVFTRDPSEPEIQATDQNPRWTPSMSLLHLAAMDPEFRVRQTESSSILSCVLGVYHLPHQLNAKETWRGWSALHMAVFFGNITAIRTLLDEDEIDRSSHDNEGKTPLDWAWFRFIEPKGQMEFWDVLPEDLQAHNTVHEANSQEILMLLMQAKATTNYYDGFIERVSENQAKMTWFPREVRVMAIITLDLTTEYNLESPQVSGVAAILAILPRVRRLEIGESKMFYIGTDGNHMLGARSPTTTNTD